MFNQQKSSEDRQHSSSRGRRKTTLEIVKEILTTIVTLVELVLDHKFFTLLVSIIESLFLKPSILLGQIISACLKNVLGKIERKGKLEVSSDREVKKPNPPTVATIVSLQLESEEPGLSLPGYEVPNNLIELFNDKFPINKKY